MEEYEVLNVGTSQTRSINVFCPSADLFCGSVNGTCGAVDGACASVNVSCGSDNNCDGGNVFPCENPGFGCRSGCGGASTTNCPIDRSLG